MGRRFDKNSGRVVGRIEVSASHQDFGYPPSARSSYCQQPETRQQHHCTLERLDDRNGAEPLMMMTRRIQAPDQNGE